MLTTTRTIVGRIFLGCMCLASTSACAQSPNQGTAVHPTWDGYGRTLSSQMSGAILPGYPVGISFVTQYGTSIQTGIPYSVNGTYNAADALANYDVTISRLGRGTRLDPVPMWSTNGQSAAENDVISLGLPEGVFSSSDSPHIGTDPYRGGFVNQATVPRQFHSSANSFQAPVSAVPALGNPASLEGLTAVPATTESELPSIPGFSADAETETFDDDAESKESTETLSLLPDTLAAEAGTVQTEDDDDSSMPWSVLPDGHSASSGGMIGSVPEDQDRQSGSGAGGGQGMSGSPAGAQGDSEGWSPSQGGSGSGLGSGSGAGNTANQLPPATIEEPVTTADQPPATTGTPSQTTPDESGSAGGTQPTDGFGSTQGTNTGFGGSTVGNANGANDSTQTSPSTGGFADNSFGNSNSTNDPSPAGDLGNSFGNSDVPNETTSGFGGNPSVVAGVSTGSDGFSRSEEPELFVPVSQPADPKTAVLSTSVESDLINGSSPDAPVVPEPGSLVLLAVGSILGGAAHRRRRKKLNAANEENAMIEPAA